MKTSNGRTESHASTRKALEQNSQLGPRLLQNRIVTEKTSGRLGLVGANTFGLLEVSLDGREQPRDGILVCWVGLAFDDDLNEGGLV